MKHNNINVVLLPNHVYEAMKSNGMDLHAMDSKINNHTKSRSLEDENNVNEYILKNLSSYDIDDIWTSNAVYFYHLFDEYVTTTYMERYFKWMIGNTYSNYKNLKQTNVMDLLTAYSNRKINLDNVINDKNNNNEVCKTVVTQNTLFIIFLDGFGNFKVYNNVGYKDYFLRWVMDTLVKSFGEEAARKSAFFTNYVKWVHKKN